MNPEVYYINDDFRLMTRATNRVGGLSLGMLLSLGWSRTKQEAVKYGKLRLRKKINRHLENIEYDINRIKELKNNIKKIEKIEV